MSGNRRWGFFREQSGDFTVYTRGADRPTLEIDAALSDTIFSSAHALWLSLQQGIAKLVNDNGGEATPSAAVSRRYDWSSVQGFYWKPKTSWLRSD